MSGASSNSLQTPGSSCRTGPIPKTISFDKTAERGDRVIDYTLVLFVLLNYYGE